MPPEDIANSGAAPTDAGSAGVGSPASTTSPSPGPSHDSGSGVDTAAASSGSMDFESIFSGRDDSPDLGLSPEVPPTIAPAAPPAAPPVQPQVPPQVAQAPAQAPTPQPQGTPGRGPGIPPGLDRYDPAQLAAALTANEAQLTEILATEVMKLSPQEVEALETNIVEAIPRLMARAVIQAQKSALTQMAALMPVAIQRHNEVMSQAHSAESVFWQALPQLDPRQHRQLVWSYASMFRRMYPQATLRDIIAHVGPMVMGAAKIPYGGGATNGQTPPGAGRRPASPFVPAGGMAPVPGSSQREMSPWEAMFVERD